MAAFTARARMPRLEYVSPAPYVDAVLAEAGFTVDVRLPLMALAAADLRTPPAPDGVTVRAADGEDDLRSVALVQLAGAAVPPGFRRRGIASAVGADPCEGAARGHRVPAGRPGCGGQPTFTSMQA